MKITRDVLKRIIRESIQKEELNKVTEIDLFGTKKAAASYDKAMKIRHDDLADIHYRLKNALREDTLQQTAVEIIKDLELKFRNMDR